MQHARLVGRSLAFTAASILATSLAGAQVAQQSSAKTTLAPYTFRLSTTSDVARAAFESGYDAYLEFDYVRAAANLHRAAVADTSLRVARAFELFLTQPVAPKMLADSITRLQVRNAGSAGPETMLFTSWREWVLGYPNSPLLANANARMAPEDNRLLADAHLRYGVGSAERATMARILREREPGSYRNQAYVAMGLPLADSVEAFAAMREALRLGPSQPFPHFAAGELLSRTRRLPEAIDQYSQALALDSSYYMAALSRGTAHLWLFHPAEARADFQRAAARAVYPAHRATLLRSSALTYLYEGDLDRGFRETERLARSLEAQGNVPAQVAVTHRALEFMAGARKDVRSVEEHIAARERLASQLTGDFSPGLALYWDALSWSMAEQPQRARASMEALERLIASRDYVGAAPERNAMRAMVLVAEKKYGEALALADSAPMNIHWKAIVGYRALAGQGRSVEAAQRIKPLFTMWPYASDALALPVAYALWGRN